MVRKRIYCNYCEIVRYISYVGGEGGSKEALKKNLKRENII